jgi:hypothetical protein
MPPVYHGGRRRRGLGAATCPSTQQLQGIVDPTDPCQSTAPSGDTYVYPSGPANLTLPPTCMAGDTLQMQNGYWVCVPGSSSAGNVFQNLFSSPVAIAAAALLGVLLFTSGGRR